MFGTCLLATVRVQLHAQRDVSARRRIACINPPYHDHPALQFPHVLLCGELGRAPCRVHQFCTCTQRIETGACARERGRERELHRVGLVPVSLLHFNATANVFIGTLCCLLPLPLPLGHFAPNRAPILMIRGTVLKTTYLTCRPHNF